MVLRSLNNIIPARIKFDSSFISLPFFLSIYLSIIGGIYRFLASLAYFLSTSFSFLGVYTLFPFLKHHFFLLGHLFSPFSIMMIWLAAHLHYRLDAYSQKSMRTGSLSFFSYPFSSFHFGTVGLNIYDTHASGRLFCHYHYLLPICLWAASFDYSSTMGFLSISTFSTSYRTEYLGLFVH